MKNTNPGLWSLGFGEIGATLSCLEKLGVTQSHLARIRSDESYRKSVAEFMLRGGVEGAVSHQIARAILGKNFFGIEEYSSLLGVNFSKGEIAKVPEFPWGKDVLNSQCPFHPDKLVRDTHFAFLGMEKIKGNPLTIMELNRMHPKPANPHFYSTPDEAWYKKSEEYPNPFANKLTLEPRWYLLLKGIIPNSANTEYSDQLRMLPEGYENPQAIVGVAGEIFSYRKNGTFHLPEIYGRSCDKSSDGHRVSVGDSVLGGVYVYNWLGDACGRIGLLATRKS